MNTYFYSGKNDLKEGEIVFVFTFRNLFQNSAHTPENERSGKRTETALSRYWGRRFGREIRAERRGSPQSLYFFSGSTFSGDMSRNHVRILQKKKLQKNKKKSEKKHKKTGWAIDSFHGKIYIHFHRRNTELRYRTNKKFFDRSGKEITD